MTEQVLVALVALALAAWIAHPLLERRRTLGAPADKRAADLLESKQSVYRSILDLEMDHEMGKLDEGDYLRLRQQSKAEALDIIRELGGNGSPESDRATLEEEIRAARARLREQ